MGTAFDKVVTKTRFCWVAVISQLTKALFDAPTGSGFRCNFVKIYPQDLKMVEQDASLDSLQSALPR